MEEDLAPSGAALREIIRWRLLCHWRLQGGLFQVLSVAVPLGLDSCSAALPRSGAFRDRSPRQGEGLLKA